MERTLFNISQVLGITIIHSLWQGLFVYFALRILLTLPFTSAKKHLLALGGLTTITVWFFYTLVNEIIIYQWQIVKPGNPSAMPLMLMIPAGITHLSAQATRYYYTIEQYLPYITLIYAAGLIYNSAVLLVARKRIKAIRRTMQIDNILQAQGTKFAGLLKITKKVQVGLSQMVDVPCITGFLKPAILLPVTITTTLSAGEIEAILLHELAHIKRNDYLVNLAQQTMRVLLFFNPFAHLTISIINRERENSCDDIVVATSQKPLVYAQALMKLEQSRQTQLPLALAAGGKKYQLLNRIERIMKPTKTTDNARHVLLTVVLFTTGILCLAWLNPTIANGKISVKNVKPVIQKALISVLPPIDTTQKKHISTEKAKKTQTTASGQTDTTDIYSNDPITNDYQLLGYTDPKAEEILTMVRKYSDAVKNYSTADEYVRLHTELQAAEKNLKNYRNDVLYDQLNEDIRKAGQDFAAKWGGDDGRNEQLGEEIKSLGSKVGQYYGTDEFKKLNNRLQKKYGIDPDKKYGDGDKQYLNYQAELTGKVPADIKDATDQIKKDGLKMHELMNSDEYKADTKHLMGLIDNLKAYHSPETEKKYQQAVTDAAEKYWAYGNTHQPELKRNLDSLKVYGDKLHAYNQSAEHRQRIKAWRDQMRTALGSDYEKIEHPDRPDSTGSK